MTNFTSFHTLHGVIQGGEAIWTFIKATASVQIEAGFALGAKVFAEAGVTVFYSASCTSVHVGCAVPIVARRTGVQTLPVLAHALAPQEEEQLLLAPAASVVLGARQAALADRV